jgi:hypothetical protein
LCCFANIGCRMKRIVLNEDEQIKFFTLNFPDKVEAVYKDHTAEVYFDTPGYFAAMVAKHPGEQPFVMIEKL